MNNTLLFYVCRDCGSQYQGAHSCDRQSLRHAAEALDALIADERATGPGILWLYRIAYRVRAKLDGLGKYRDRAEMARRICEAGGTIIQ